MKRSIFALISLFLLSAVGAHAQSQADFPYPTLPYYISDEGGAAAEWMTLHFWDKYDFAACETKYGKEVNEQGFFDFLNALYTTTPEHSFVAIGVMMNGAAVSEDGYWYFLEMAEEMLYDPSSPIRNDLLWEQFVRHAVGERSPLDEASKSRYHTLLALVTRNQQGSIATDFTYTLANGTQGRLHKISAPFTMIWFYNPGCGECARTKAQIEATGYLDLLHSVGALEVLALYPDGEVDKWREALPENPEWWISAYDKERVIQRKGLYDLKAIPTIYLLDAQKRVILKDPGVEGLLEVLEIIIYGN